MNGDSKLDPLQYYTANTNCSYPENDFDSKFSVDERSEQVWVSSNSEFRVRVSSEIDRVGVGKNMESSDLSDDRNRQVDAEDDLFCNSQHDREVHAPGRQSGIGNGLISQTEHLLSEFDRYVANKKNDEIGTGISRALNHGLQVGDMVWGRVKSHPWWPGHIYNEAFASPLVRRTRREGHVLVAFFGDCSYGWFDPAELIPFCSNLAEKSRQTNSRTFVKAVEEAVYEASRRQGLGLTCKCQNPNNFRLTNVEGYFSVDVPDYEPGVIYSWDQILRARNSFKPDDTLDFIKHLALFPQSGNQRSISFIQHKAVVLSYRSAVFEQYDEPYAQAFAMRPVCPSQALVNSDVHSVRNPPKVPLSGPLRIAEASGVSKGSSKSMKVMGNLKKDRYLFKRRDEPGNSITHPVCKGLQAMSSGPLAYPKESSDAAENYVFQKRESTVSLTPQNMTGHGETEFVIKNDVASTAAELSGAEAVTMYQIPHNNSVMSFQGIAIDTQPSDIEKSTSQEMIGSSRSDSNMATKSDLPKEMVSLNVIYDAPLSSQSEGETSMKIKSEGNGKMSVPSEKWLQPELVFACGVGGTGLNQVKDSQNDAFPSPAESKPMKSGADGRMKKMKALKRPTNNLSSDSNMIQMKKKKKRKELISETNSGPLQKISGYEKAGASLKKSRVQASPVAMATREFHEERKLINADGGNLMPTDGKINSQHELSLLLSDLRALALDPFHGIGRNAPVTVRQFFLQFRSSVYQKSLVLSPPVENGPFEVCDTIGASVGSIKEHVKIMPPSNINELVKTKPSAKPVKQAALPDDPAKAGKKRVPSDRQEDIAAKRLKKIKEQKTPDDQKISASQKVCELPPPPKSAKMDPVRKVNPPVKATEPTMLVIKFPPQTSLPSLAELKARFARFGPIDHSGLRVFWKSSTCRVVFLHKLDAQAAHKYAVGNNSLFGNVSVRCYLREMGDPTPEVSETLRAKDPAVTQQLASIFVSQPPLGQPAIQLKSCLKKSSGEETVLVSGNGGSTTRGTPRVKFMLGGEESSNGEQSMVGNRNRCNNANFGDGGVAPSSIAMEFNSKNFPKFVSEPPPLIPPTQSAKAPQNNMRNPEMAPRNVQNFANRTSAPATSNAVDISQQMISLMTRCNDVVTNLMGKLGYVPYHPL